MWFSRNSRRPTAVMSMALVCRKRKWKLKSCFNSVVSKPCLRQTIKYLSYVRWRLSFGAEKLTKEVVRYRASLSNEFSQGLWNLTWKWNNVNNVLNENIVILSPPLQRNWRRRQQRNGNQDVSKDKILEKELVSSLKFDMNMNVCTYLWNRSCFLRVFHKTHKILITGNELHTLPSFTTWFTHLELDDT